MIEASPRSRAWRIYWGLAAGRCALAALLLGLRGVASILPSPSFDVSESGFEHWVVRRALPSSALAVRHLASAQAGNERALRDFNNVDASAPESAAWGWLGATYFSVATGKARDTHFQLLARTRHPRARRRAERRHRALSEKAGAT